MPTDEYCDDCNGKCVELAVKLNSGTIVRNLINCEPEPTPSFTTEQYTISSHATEASIEPTGAPENEISHDNTVDYICLVGAVVFFLVSCCLNIYGRKLKLKLY